MTEEDAKKVEETTETPAEPTAETAPVEAAAKEATPKTEKASTETKYKRTARGKKRAIRKISQGRAYIKATYNNTIVTLTDMNGNTLAWASAGNCGFKGPKKATPYAASVIVKSVAEKAAEYGLKDLNVYVKGIGSGRDSAIRSLNANGFSIQSIKDMTPVPHNGCRLAGRRRM